MSLSPWIVAPVLLLLGVAARSDTRSRRIPNALTFPALLLGLAANAMLGGRAELVAALAGMAIAGGVLLPGWLMGWMGAGDVKLMAAVGAWLAFPQAVIAVLAACVAGGVIAAGLAARRGVLTRALTGAAWLGAWTFSGAARAGTPPPITSGIRFPFALAALAGTTFALWVKS